MNQQRAAIWLWWNSAHVHPTMVGCASEKVSSSPLSVCLLLPLYLNIKSSVISPSVNKRGASPLFRAPCCQGTQWFFQPWPVTGWFEPHNQHHGHLFCGTLRSSGSPPSSGANCLFDPHQSQTHSPVQMDMGTFCDWQTFTCSDGTLKSWFSPHHTRVERRKAPACLWRGSGHGVGSSGRGCT